MLQETRGRHGNLNIERCTESLVFLFQRNKEIFFQEEKRELKPEFRQRYKPKEGGKQQGRDLKLHELSRTDGYILKNEKKIGISEIENIFFGTNPVYELKPKKGTDDLILRNSSWLCLRKIKRKHGGWEKVTIV